MLLVPGKYILQHKKDDRNFLIYQEGGKDLDLNRKFSIKTPRLSQPVIQKLYIPAWSSSNEDQIPWTFPPVSPSQK